VDHLRTLHYLPGGTAPRAVLSSPIAHEHPGNPLLPHGKEHNQRLAKISQVTAEVANAKGAPHVGRLPASRAGQQAASEPLTINGIHLEDKGNRQLAQHLTTEVLKKSPQLDEAGLERLREAVMEKDRHWFNRYRAASGNDVWGSRSVQDGNHATLNRELLMLDLMTANRDFRVWARAKGQDHAIDDSNVPEPVKVGTHIV